MALKQASSLSSHSLTPTSYRDTLMRSQSSTHSLAPPSQTLSFPPPTKTLSPEHAVSVSFSRSVTDASQSPQFARSSSKRITFVDTPEIMGAPRAASDTRLSFPESSASFSSRKSPLTHGDSRTFGENTLRSTDARKGANGGGEDMKGTYTSERLRLLALLQQMGPLSLYNTLVSQLSSLEGDSDRRRTVQAALTMIFPPQKEVVREVVHCRRCHGSFDPKCNLSGDCRIAHADSPTSRHELVKKSNEQTVWKLGCCGMKIFAAGDVTYIRPTEEHGYCYQGTHALDDTEVEWYNMVTIFRCNGRNTGQAAEAEKPCTRVKAVSAYATVPPAASAASM